MMKVNVTKTLLATLVVVMMFNECQSMPRPRRRLDLNINIDCSEIIVCDKSGPSVCATDGTTYTNECKLRLANQQKNCNEGDFNPIMPVHPGSCDD